MSFHTDRRRFLKGLSLGVSLPILGPMAARAATSSEGGTETLRFLFVVEGNSVPAKQICPNDLSYTEREKRSQFSEDALDGKSLPVALQPVAAFRDRMTIIQGLSGRMCSGGHSSDHGALGAFHANQGRNVQAATIDSMLGHQNPGVYESLVLGISSDPKKAVAFNCSASGRGRSLATVLDPALVYQKLFGGVAKGRSAADFSARRNLLDHMRTEIKRVERQLGSVGREKLDMYLSSFENLSHTSQRLIEKESVLEKLAPQDTDKFSSMTPTDRLDSHFELATAALIGGLTNSVTIASGVGFPHFNITFNELGVATSKHRIGHGLYLEDDPTAWNESEQIRAYHFKLIARTLRKLGEIPEGNGTMLDNTVVVYLSDGAETHHSRCFEWPFVLIGDAGGRLKSGGRYLQFPDYGLARHRTMNTLYNTLLHAAGNPQDDFGMVDPTIDESMHRGPLDELLA